MASGMKYWLGASILGSALVAVWLIPPDGLGPGISTELETVENRYVALSRDMRNAHAVVQRMRWADSLPALALARAGDGVAQGFPRHDAVTPEVVAGFERLQRHEIDGLDRRDGEMTFGYFYQPLEHAAEEGLAPPRTSAANLKETYVGDHEGRPYCLQVRVVNATNYGQPLAESVASWGARLDADPDMDSNMLGNCRQYLRYGLAGPGIQHWLEDGALAFAAEDNDLRRERLGLWQNRASLKSVLRFGYDIEHSLVAERCMNGARDACLALVTEPRFLRTNEDERYIVANSPAASLTSNVFRSPFGQADDFLLLDLERQFGQEAFARFWRSELPVQAAFEGAFGIGMSDWVAEWATAQFGEGHSGPTVPRNALLLSVLMVGFFTGLAGLTHRRRRVA